ncbi:isopentenyl-diphosphate delta-isomerase [Arthrobacter subterraneus]|uniref:Isopentenyl-diphosphate Delta-isomerase n=1 Tax=Arthrobacter subterraneus TaxID=335973 RepID=A0A1G8KLP2_9MICC|nr:isopentenyl-diphosphate Delta-isomerase [Arthrobacter subterraneus]SDI44357.1 isopentenyl-diphosphate delta-isomerase [Arthrobacter subterraneus]
MNRTAELVVLAAEDGTPVGTEDKATVHSTSTPLHLAFSAHIYDDDGRILITRRALSKRTWPGVWTNSFCGHPGPGEATEDAVRRRAEQELGLRLDRLELRLPDFRYRAVDASGVVENEICPVYTARAASPVDPREDEVMEVQWADPLQLTAAVAAAPWAFSPWLTLQLPLLYPERFTSPE